MESTLNHTEYVSLAISILALAGSAFTFYWTSLRDKRSFKLIRIDSLSNLMNPEFALINSGGSDILVTSVLCSFVNAEGNGHSISDKQRLLDSENSFTIQKHKSHHCKIVLPTNYDEQFVRDGEYKKNGTFELYHRDMAIIVEWIDSSGTEYKAEPKIFNYGFNIGGRWVLSQPLQKRHDLYKQCVKNLR